MNHQGNREGTELTSEQLRRQDEVKADRRKIASWLGIPAALLVAAVATDCGIDQIDQYGIVQQTRDKAEAVVEGSCEVDSFGPRDRLKIPSRRRVEYECEGRRRPPFIFFKLGLSKRTVICESDETSREYACRRATFREEMKRLEKQMKALKGL